MIGLIGQSGAVRGKINWVQVLMRCFLLPLQTLLFSGHPLPATPACGQCSSLLWGYGPSASPEEIGVRRVQDKLVSIARGVLGTLIERAH